MSDLYQSIILDLAILQRATFGRIEEKRQSTQLGELWKDLQDFRASPMPAKPASQSEYRS